MDSTTPPTKQPQPTPLTINTADLPAGATASAAVKTPSLAARLQQAVRRVSISAPASPALQHSPAPSLSLAGDGHADALMQQLQAAVTYPLQPDAYDVQQVIGMRTMFHILSYIC